MSSQTTPNAVLDLCSHEAICYIDTIEIFMRNIPPGTVKRLRVANGRGTVWAAPVRAANGAAFGWVITIQQPTRRTVLAADRLCRKNSGAVLRRVDLATDFIASSPHDKQAIREWLLRHVLMKHRPRGHMYDFEDTIYWVWQEGRKLDGKKRSNRDLVFYSDRECKITGECDVPHLEIKMLNAAAVRRAGFRRPKDLLKFDPISQLQKHIKLVTYDIEAFTQRIVRQSVQHERMTFLRRRKESLFSDCYRAGYASRVRQLLQRLHQNRIQLLKETFEGIKLKSLSFDLLHLPDRLSWPL